MSESQFFELLVILAVAAGYVIGRSHEFDSSNRKKHR